ncbi:MAG: RNA polymerase sigma factor [Actinobacteria bacterium]|jgi:RNA polymerase sigma-70 factor (ECF subfamily)|nr:RNA polymerase sigma factor [Actinomycetota bacterium]
MVGDFDQALALARQGDNEGVSWLYDTYHPSLLRYLNWEELREAADIEGDVWLAVAQNLKRFKGDQQHFKAWLFTIARRRVIDERRKRSRNRTVYVVPESLYVYGSGGDMAQEAVDSLSAQEAISRLTAGIPKDQAEVIVLRVLGGLSVAEVAEITGKRPGTVRVLQHRALRHMSEESGAGLESQVKRVGKRGMGKR